MKGLLEFYDPITAQTILLLRQMRSCEGLLLNQQRSAQNLQLLKLFRHAYQCSGFWRQRIESVGHNFASLAQMGLDETPPLLREDLQNSFLAMRARWQGLKDDRLITVTSSGSTGIPVRVEKSLQFQGPLDDAYALLELKWHQRDPNGTVAFIGYQIEDKSLSSWGGIYHQMGYRGRYEKHAIADRSLGDQLDWLRKIRPRYLKASPFLVEQMANVAIGQGVDLAIDQIISMSERVSPTQRRLAQKAFGAKIIDRYSSEETGIIALQCPKHDHMHVLSPSIIVEIVDENNKACPPGKPGRVLVTNLYSYAMPIIRYDLGDIAEWGQACDCGIQWPVISKLWGRVRNKVVLPDGSVFPMPFLGDDLAKIKSIKEFRLKQYEDNELELALTVIEPLIPQELEFIAEVMRKSGLAGLPLYVRQVAKIDWEFGRKREEFVRVNQSCPTFEHGTMQILL